MREEHTCFRAYFGLGFKSKDSLYRDIKINLDWGGLQGRPVFITEENRLEIVFPDLVGADCIRPYNSREKCYFFNRHDAHHVILPPVGAYCIRPYTSTKKNIFLQI